MIARPPAQRPLPVSTPTAAEATTTNHHRRHPTNPRRRQFSAQSATATSFPASDPLLTQLSSRLHRPIDRRRATTSRSGSDFNAFGFPTATFPLGDGSASRQLLATVHHLNEQLCLEREESQRLRVVVTTKTHELNSARSLLERAQLIDPPEQQSDAAERTSRLVYRTTHGVVQGVRTTLNVHVIRGAVQPGTTADHRHQQQQQPQHQHHHFGGRYRYEWSVTAYDATARALHLGVFAEIKLHHILQGTTTVGLLEQLHRLCRPGCSWKQPQVVEALEKRIAMEMCARLEFDVRVYIFPAFLTSYHLPSACSRCWRYFVYPLCIPLCTLCARIRD